jgi:isopentenyl-diphosphate delta-isomerase
MSPFGNGHLPPIFWRKGVCLSINQRKADHIRINLEEDVQFPALTTGLERFRFVHQALPELDLDELDTRVDLYKLFKRSVSAPILVSSMTGGTSQAMAINRNLAEAAQARGLAMGLGSQRAGLLHHDTAATFRVRDVAPDILLLANIGAVQLNYGFTVDDCRRAVEMIEADALILHLNPLQEVLQAEGDFNWRGLLGKIEEVCRQLQTPVVAKEVGWGISEETARLLIEAGVSAIDVAGAGGTSWSQVEMHRAPTERLRRLAAAFSDWGIPTADTLQTVYRVSTEMEREMEEERAEKRIPVFASGGIRTGQDIAKCVALGADLVGLASPFLKAAVISAEAVADEMELLEAELRIAMFCSGAATLAGLRRPGLLIQAGDPQPGTDPGDSHVQR